MCDFTKLDVVNAEPATESFYSGHLHEKGGASPGIRCEPASVESDEACRHAWYGIQQWAGHGMACKSVNNSGHGMVMVHFVAGRWYRHVHTATQLQHTNGHLPTNQHIIYTGTYTAGSPPPRRQVASAARALPNARAHIHEKKKQPPHRNVYRKQATRRAGASQSGLGARRRRTFD